MLLNTWSQQCSFLDCWLSLAHFLICQLKRMKLCEWRWLNHFWMPQNLGMVFFWRVCNSMHELLCMYQILQLQFSLVALKIQGKDSSVWLLLTLNISNNERHLKQGSEFKVKFTKPSWKKEFMWILAKRTHTAPEISSDVHTALFYCSACVALLTRLNTSLNWTWFGYACRVLKGMHILKITHFGYAPVAVKGTDGGMRWLWCLGHISCLEKVFQQRFLYATLNFQDVTVSVNKLFEFIKFTPRWIEKCTLFFFLTLLKGKGWGQIIVLEISNLHSMSYLPDPSKAPQARTFVFCSLCTIEISSVNNRSISGACFDIRKW